MNRACPPADQLVQLATGILPDPPAMDIESHVMECPECQKVTASLKVGDTFIDQIRQAARQSADPQSVLEPADQARVQRIIAEASGLRPQSADTQLSDATIAPLQSIVLAELARAWQPPQQRDELGRLGGYRILRLLGAGGMGAVLLAEDQQLNRQVALKVMRPQAAADPAAAERFLREARAVAAVRHDNVVTIYQVGQDQGMPFIAQELLIGETLEERLKRDGHLPVAEAVGIARQVAAGLAAAHVRGLMHRDVKPANVWLEPADASGPPRVKLLDFGLARSYVDDDAQLTQAGMIVGTPAYMAPEQAAGQSVDERADLFGLGVVLYRMLTGTSPFHKPNTMATLQALALETPPPPSVLVPSVPADLSSLVMRLLEKSPDKRPASAIDVAQALSEIFRVQGSGFGVQDSSRSVASSLRPAVSRSRPRRPALVALALGGLAATILAGVILIVRNKEGKEVARVEVPDGGTLEVAAADASRPAPAQAAAPSPSKPVPVAASVRPARSVPKTEPLSPFSFVSRPASLAGIKRWTLETVAPRGRCSEAQAIALGPEGKQIVLADGSNTLRIYDTGDRSLRSAIVLQKRVYCVDWSRDGQLLAALGDGTLSIIEANRGKLRSSVPINQGDLRWSADSQWVAISGGYVWNRERSALSREPNLGPNPTRLAWSPVAPILAAGCRDKTVRLFDVSTHKVLHTLTGHTTDSIDVAWSPDGKRVASVGQGDTLRFWDALSGESLATLPIPGVKGRALAWSPDGNLVAVGKAVEMQDTLFIDAKTYQVLDSVGSFYQTRLQHQCWSPDAALIYRAAEYFAHGHVCIDVVDVASRRRVASWTGMTSNYSAHEGLSPDGTRMLGIFKERLNGFDLETGVTQAAKNWGGGSAAWSADSQLVAVPTYDWAAPGFGVDVLDRSFSRVARVTGDYGSVAALSPDGREAAVSNGKTFEVWDCAKGTRKAMFPAAESNATARKRDVFQVRWSPSGDYIAASHQDEVVVLWSPLEPEAPVFELPARGYPLLHWSSAADMLVVAAGKELRILDPKQRDLIRTVTASATVLAAEYDLQTRRVAFLTADGKLSQTTGDELAMRTIGMTQPCDSARFLAGGQLLATSRHLDPTVFLWDANSAEPRGAIVPFASEHHVLISPDGHYRGTPGVENELVVVAETDAGEQHTFTLEEFSQKYNWRNDPRKVVY